MIVDPKLCTDQAPEPLRRNWTDILTVDEFADFCLPRGPFEEKITPEMSENCLFLNIYVPGASDFDYCFSAKINNNSCHLK